jgi:NadR type nicotinamide-nucleotide adenylyltransferase
MHPIIHKIVIIGPESTGKSTLCAALATHFNTIWCKEYAREYLMQHGTNYNYNDLLTIAKGQLQLEQKATQKVVEANKNFLIVDTEMYVMKTWCEFVFNQCHNYILQQAAVQQYSLYLLCNIDLPWSKDELREYPDYATREKLFYYYKDIVINSGVPWALISGIGNERINSAIAAVHKTLM